MEYLRIKRSKSQLRANGSRYAKPMLITKTEKYGKCTREQAISVKKPILITGGPDSGKTRWIKRLHEHALEIWGTKSQAAPLLLDARSPLPSWSDFPALREWWKQRQKTLLAGLRKPWADLSQDERSNALPVYCADTGAVLFIDDAHKLRGGLKLKLAAQCIQTARIWVVTTYQEERLPPSLLKQVTEANPQRFHLRLNTEVSEKSMAD
jgi:hypothetical protein